MTACAISLLSRGKDLATPAVNEVVLLALLFVADLLIGRRSFFGHPFWALVDSGVHGLVALLVTVPIIHSVPTAWQLLALAHPCGSKSLRGRL